MPISHHLKAIFIHIPKNAGESIEKAMGMYGGLPAETLWGRVENRFVLQHLTATELQDSGLVTQEIWRQYFKFAVVRNPWSKAVSEYNWYLRYGPSVSFNEWLDSVEHRIKINQSIHMKEIGHNIEQYKFVFDENGELLVDSLIRFESIETEFKELCRERGWNCHLTHEQATKSKSDTPFRDYYDQDSAEKVAHIYRMDIEKLGYSIVETFS